MFGFCGCGLLGAVQAGPEDLGVFPEALAVAAIAFAAGLMGIAQTGSRRVRRRWGQRIAEVSHELRTPLTHILGFSEMIERQLFGEIGALRRVCGTHSQERRIFWGW